MGQIAHIERAFPESMFTGEYASLVHIPNLAVTPRLSHVAGAGREDFDEFIPGDTYELHISILQDGLMDAIADRAVNELEEMSKAIVLSMHVSIHSVPDCIQGQVMLHHIILQTRPSRFVGVRKFVAPEGVQKYKFDLDFFLNTHLLTSARVLYGDHAA